MKVLHMKREAMLLRQEKRKLETMVLEAMERNEPLTGEALLAQQRKVNALAAALTFGGDEEKQQEELEQWQLGAG